MSENDDAAPKDPAAHAAELRERLSNATNNVVSKSNVVSMAGSPAKTVADFKAAAEMSKQMLPIMIVHAQNQAAIRRASYLALREAGFTDAQAMELCKTP